MSNQEFWIRLVDLVVKIFAVAIGGTWAVYKLREYRQFKSWVQLELDANIYRLTNPEFASPRT